MSTPSVHCIACGTRLVPGPEASQGWICRPCRKNGARWSQEARTIGARLERPANPCATATPLEAGREAGRAR